MTTAAVPISLTPRQARLWRQRLIFTFLGVVSLAVAAEWVTSPDDRCETKDQPLLNPSGSAVINPSGQPVVVGQAYKCRPSKGWKISFREGFPNIGLEYDRLPELARPPATLP